jgi:hypothetical protein
MYLNVSLVLFGTIQYTCSVATLLLGHEETASRYGGQIGTYRINCRGKPT